MTRSKLFPPFLTSDQRGLLAKGKGSRLNDLHRAHPYFSDSDKAHHSVRISRRTEARVERCKREALNRPLRLRVGLIR